LELTRRFDGNDKNPGVSALTYSVIEDGELSTGIELQDHDGLQAVVCSTLKADLAANRDYQKPSMILHRVSTDDATTDADEQARINQFITDRRCRASGIPFFQYSTYN
jgi:hypothetical protein